VKSYSIGVIGIGKITQDQHLPVIAKDARFKLAGLVSQRGLQQPGVPTFRTPAELYAALPDLDAVAICTPPSVRHAIAREALDAGKNVLLEKPPTPTMAEFHDLVAYGAARGKVIFATWHSQYNAAVDEAKKRLSGQKIRSLHIEWKEDVRRWHPGQGWLWQPGGFGVFDPGMNALSILTKLVPEAIFPRAARLFVPENCGAPIAADLELTTASGLEITAAFDFRESGPQRWNIDLETDAGAMKLSAGGGFLTLGEEPVPPDAGSLDAEYETIYRRFGGLVPRAASDVDTRPLQLVSDIFLVAKQIPVESFEDPLPG